MKFHSRSHIGELFSLAHVDGKVSRLGMHAHALPLIHGLSWPDKHDPALLRRLEGVRGHVAGLMGDQGPIVAHVDLASRGSVLEEDGVLQRDKMSTRR